jgi:hypothetical protein
MYLQIIQEKQAVLYVYAYNFRGYDSEKCPNRRISVNKMNPKKVLSGKLNFSFIFTSNKKRTDKIGTA